MAGSPAAAAHLDAAYPASVSTSIIYRLSTTAENWIWHTFGDPGDAAKVGRWLAAEHPEAEDPTLWTRQICAAWVASLDRMNVGDFVQRTVGVRDRIGKPLAAATKATVLTATGTFFRDCQEWEWLPRRFDPQRAQATPRSIAALLGPNPRVISDDIWAKLLWAGLNLEPPDLPDGSLAGQFYPIELVRAVTITWLFSGLRSDEIARLRWTDRGPHLGRRGRLRVRQ
jgi:hypothetical protein